MIRDPAQTENVIGKYRAEADHMRSAYEAWWEKTRGKMVNEAVPLSPIRPFHQHYAAQKKAEGIPLWEDPLVDR